LIIAALREMFTSLSTFHIIWCRGGYVECCERKKGQAWFGGSSGFERWKGD
jgi:hypothetical protein